MCQLLVSLGCHLDSFAYVSCTISETTCHSCVYIGAELLRAFVTKTLSKLIQIAIKEKELKRKSCVTSHILIPPLYVKMNYLNWLFRVGTRSNKWYQSSGRGVHTTTAWICRNLSFLLTFSHTFSVWSGSYGWNGLNFDYIVCYTVLTNPRKSQVKIQTKTWWKLVRTRFRLSWHRRFRLK